MRKSTLLLVVIAAALVAFVYWHEFKRTPAEKTKTNPMVFKFEPEQVASVTLSQPGGTIVIQRQGSGWQIVNPVDTRADKSAIDGLLNDVTLSHSSRTLSPAEDQLKAFGLAPPAVTLDFQLQNGQHHRLELGSADYSGTSAYARADHSSSVILVPVSILQDGKKTVANLRDNSVLGISADDVQSFSLKTPQSDIEATRQGSNPSEQWMIDKPGRMAGDSNTISTLLTNVASATLSKVASESAGDLGRWGLAHPAISFKVHLNSDGDRTLALGRKEGADYYARDSSREMVFLVPASFEKQLDQTLFDLRDKQILHGQPDDFTRIDYIAGSVQFSCGVDRNGDWTMFEPASDKGKKVANWKIFNPLSTVEAKKIIDSPSASLMAEVARPAIQIVLTRKRGGKETLRVSKPAGKDVYIWVSDGSGLYLIGKDTYDSLLFTGPSDILR